MKNTLRLLVLIGLFILLVLPRPAPAAPGNRLSAAAQQAPEVLDTDIRFERISNEQGLSMSVVYSIAQDSQGFLWFASEDGLNRYDGKQIVIYKHDPANPNSLSANWVYALATDPQGMVWLGTDSGGLDRYDPRTGTFTHFRNDPANPASLASDHVMTLFDTRDGKLWLGTGTGVDRLDKASGTFEHLGEHPNAPEFLGKAVIKALYQDSLGRLWIGTSEGLVQFDQAAGTFTVYQNQPDDPNSLSDDNVTEVLEDQTGQIWAATRNGGLNRLDPVTGTFEHFVNIPGDAGSLSNNTVQALYQDSAGVLWVGTWGGGLNRFDARSGRFTHYKNESENPHSLASNFIHTIYEDTSGAIWVATWGAGLSKFDRASEQFIHYRSRPNDPNSLSNSLVWSIFETNDSLWVGTQAGLDRIDRATGEFKHYTHQPDDPNSLSAYSIQSIYVDQAGQVWAGASKGGLNRLDPATGQITRYNDALKDSYGNEISVSHIIEDAAGQLWLGTSNGLKRLDPTSGEFVHFDGKPDDPNALSSNYILALYLDRSGILWIGTEDGLARFDPRSGKFTHWKNDPADPNSLSDNRISSILGDSQGGLWLGTYGGGLNHLDLQTDQVKIYREKEGMPNDTVYGILEDDNGYLWISTNNGLARFDPKTETFKIYQAQDGLQSNEFNSHAYFKSANGELFFGGINGVTAFHPENIVDNEFVPPVALVSLEQGGQPVVKDSPVEYLPEAVLRWPNNFFEFEFAALSYVQPEQNQYAYKLEGFDRDWNYAGTKNFGRYTNLPGGTYTLRLKAANNDEVWNEEGASLSIKVIPPFWQTLTFQAGLGLFVALLIFGGYRFRVRAIKDRNRQLERQVDERTREIERRHHELAALYHADESLYRNLDLNLVLQALVDSAVELLKADKGSLLVWDEQRTRLTARVTRGFHTESAGRLSFAPGDGVAGTVGVTGVPALVEDVTTDSRVLRSVTDPEGIRSFMQVPITVDEQIFGVFSADFLNQRKFSEDDLRLLTSLAQRAGLAIKNAQLYEHTQEQAVVEERNRLARELHDAVTQTLFSASLLAEALPAAWEENPEEGRQLLSELRQLSRGALAEMRTLLMELRPSALAEADLGDLLRQLGEAAAGREGIPVTVTLDGRCDLPTDVHIALYRIAQEALNNALKHARASQISLHLRRMDNPENGDTGDPRQEVVLTIRDDGRGFDPERVAPNHFGLGIMRERAQAVGATLTVESQPGRGAQITVLWEASPPPVDSALLVGEKETRAVSGGNPRNGNYGAV